MTNLSMMPFWLFFFSLFLCLHEIGHGYLSPFLRLRHRRLCVYLTYSTLIYIVIEILYLQNTTTTSIYKYLQN